MDMEIRSIDYTTALSFFIDHRAWMEKVTVKEAGDWFGGYRDGALVGIVSTMMLGKWCRVKTLFVAKAARRSGVATGLVRHVSAGKACSAFAFDASKPVFEACGFREERTNKNGIHFMRKDE